MQPGRLQTQRGTTQMIDRPAEKEIRFPKKERLSLWVTFRFKFIQRVFIQEAHVNANDDDDDPFTFE